MPKKTVFENPNKPKFGLLRDEVQISISEDPAEL